MLHLPPIPAWESLHPLVIHFPIVLLLLSPIFLLISAALPPARGVPWRSAALLILLLGTVSLFVAAATGEAAGELAERGGGVDAVLSAHEQLASETRILFFVLSVILLGMTALPRILRRQETRVSTTLLPLAYLVFYSVGVLYLVNTAHAGGRLVHEFGVHAMMPASSGPAEASVEESREPVESRTD
jgi:uncharacterized membrane protein